MSQHPKLHLLALAAVAALIAAPVQAQSAASDSYYYLGIGGGQSRASDDDGRVNQSLLGGEYRVQGMNADLVGTLPLTENLSALGRVGVTYARTRADFNGSGAVVVANPSASDRDTNAKAGPGPHYAIGSSLLLGGEVENFRVSDTQGKHNQVALYSVSLVMPFGRAPTASRTA